MLGLDETLAELGREGGPVLAVVVALLLGLRHATDPDHLTAVSTLVVSEPEHRGLRRAGRLGLAWGAGHGITLLLLGLPVVIAGPFLPDAVQRAAEVAVGVLVVALAVRLLIRWRRGYLHVHVHEHGGVRHVHPHVHEHGSAGHAHRTAHDHAHHADLGRTPRAAVGIGFLHGAGGSAAAAILLVGAIPDRLAAAVALALFAVMSALAMGAVTWAFGSALVREPVLRRLTAAVPVYGTLALAFGTWYALGALGAVPYNL
jgi:ABC-type nickel/cobalt efflux system permease component RcnA